MSRSESGNQISEKGSSTQCNVVGSKAVIMDYSNSFTTDLIFSSREDLIKWSRDVGKSLGFVIVILKSDSGDSSRKPRLLLGCKKSGSYRTVSKKTDKEGKISKKAVTDKCACPFRLKGMNLTNGDGWMLVVVCGVHNHVVARQLEGHSYTGRLSDEETSLLVDMPKHSVKPKELLIALKPWDEVIATTTMAADNACQNYWVKEKAGRSKLEQLMEKLAEYRYFEWHTSCTDTDNVLDLFWAHPTSVELLHAFPHVVIMECKYKTNAYHLPLLEIVGVTSTGKTFSVAFAYLQSERVESYEWALGRLGDLMEKCKAPEVILTDIDLVLMNAVKKVFPTTKHLLCRWHINKNVLAKCKKIFDTKQTCDAFINSWNVLVLSSTIETYNVHLAQLHSEYSSYPAALEYVHETWLDPYREKFVAFWTDTCLHFGATTTNMVESQHAVLKRHLGTSQGTFEAAWSKIHKLIEFQHKNIKASFEKSLTVVKNSFKLDVFKELHGFISIVALNVILTQVKRAEAIGVDPVACGCGIRRTHGLPCAHECAEFLKLGRPIPLDCIHPHWKKLDAVFVDVTQNDNVQMTCQPELEMILQHFNQSNTKERTQIIKKLRDIISPESTPLGEPEVNNKKRGRPKEKLENSIGNDPSAIEVVQSTYDNCSPNIMSVKVGVVHMTPQGQPKVKISRAVINYIHTFPEVLHPYIQHVQDVTSDGNCGFRAVADLMGFGEDDWARVRRDLLDELLSHIDYYRKLYGVNERVDEFRKALDFFDPCPQFCFWMSMPDMGYLIASCYNVVLYHLSSQQCLTFLPLRSEPVPIVNRREIAIGFVDGNHFVKVFLAPGHPVPPIASNWIQHRRQCAEGWDSAYNSRIQQFGTLVSSDVIIKEAVDVD